MIYALLGDIPIEVPQWPMALNRKQGHNYAEHQPVTRAPLLQSTGRTLIEFTMDGKLHRQFGTAPAASLARLRSAVAEATALSLVFGTGEYPGKFVIVDLSEATESAGQNGDQDAVFVTLTLREYVENDRLASPIRSQLESARGLFRQAAEGVRRLFGN